MALRERLGLGSVELGLLSKPCCRTRYGRGQRAVKQGLALQTLNQSCRRQPRARVSRLSTRAREQISCQAFDAAARPGFGTSSSFSPSLPGRNDQAQQTGNLQAAIAKLKAVVSANERLLVVAASTLIMSISHTSLRPVLPMYAKGFGVGAAAVGMTVSVYAMGRLLMNLPAGMLADHYGRKPLLVWGPLVTAIGMLGCGLSRTFTHLLVARFVTGMGSALQMSGSQLFLADISQPHNRARSLGTNHAASQVGSLVGPAIGGYLADASGLRAPFTMTGAAALLAALYGWLRLPETRKSQEPLRWRRKRPAPAQPAPPSAAAAEVAQPSTSLSSQPERSSSAASPIRSSPDPAATATAPAEASSSAVSHAESSLHQPARQRRRLLVKTRQLFRNADFWAIAAVNAVMFATANGGRSTLMPLLAVSDFGLNTTLLGLLFAGMGLISLMGTMPASWVADKLGRKWTIVPSCVGLAAALALMGATGNPHIFMAAAVLYACSNACIGATPAAYAADVMPSNISGFALGIYRCAGDIGLMVGPALLGFVADLTTVQTALQANAIALAVVVTYFGLCAHETRHLRQKPQPLKAA
ncbi:hypothetical protein WJX74_001706 [Apatococcus lobatus]|uniref:Major facilitator superfamily (MFS) profile domain-containing protein n=1 Tax=Apatococcus lobatus TaxID=904363 RepID=A0AAW1R9K5_9CHLO